MKSYQIYTNEIIKNKKTKLKFSPLKQFQVLRHKSCFLKAKTSQINFSR